MSFLLWRLVCTRPYCSMVFKARDRLGFLRPLRSASSASDCGDVRRIVASTLFLLLFPHHSTEHVPAHAQWKLVQTLGVELQADQALIRNVTAAPSPRTHGSYRYSSIFNRLIDCLLR